MLERGCVDLLVKHKPAKPRNRKELAEMTTLLETLAENETKHTPAMERFIETLMAQVLQFEEEIQPSPGSSPAGVLRYLTDERGLRRVDLVQSRRQQAGRVFPCQPA